MGITTGSDGVLDDVFSYQVYNSIKNHWRGSAAPADAQAGMIFSDSDDGKLYHYTGGAWVEITQGLAGVNNGYIPFQNAAAFDESPLFCVAGTGNVGMGMASFGDNADYVFALLSGTAPTTSPGDCFQLYGADYAGGAGKACPHIRIEDGTIVRLNQDVSTLASPTFATITMAGITGTTEVVVNDNHADLDFRIEGDTISNLLQTDAGNDEVILGAFAGFAVEFDNGNSGANKTIDWGKSNKQTMAMTEACALTFTAPGNKGNVLLKVTTVNNFALTFPGTVKWPGGTKPTQSSGAADVDIYTFYFDGTNYYGNGSLDFS